MGSLFSAEYEVGGSREGKLGEEGEMKHCLLDKENQLAGETELDCVPAGHSTPIV